MKKLLSRFTLLLALSGLAGAEEPARRLLLPLPHNGPIQAMAFNPARSRLATADENGLVKIWNWQTRSPEMTLSPARGEERKIDWVGWADDQTLAVHRTDLQIRYYDVASGAELVRIAGQGRYAPALLPDMQLAVVAEPTAYAASDSEHAVSEGLIAEGSGPQGADPGPVIQVLSGRDGKVVRTLPIPGVEKTQQAWVRAMVASPDGKRLCYVVHPIHEGSPLLVEADAATGARLRSVELKEQDAPEQLVYNADGSAVAGWTGNQVTVWDAAGVRNIHNQQSGVVGVQFTPANDVVYMINNGGGWLYKIPAGSSQATMVRKVERGDSTAPLLVSPEGAVVLTRGAAILDATSEQDLIKSPALNRTRAVLFHPTGRLLTGLTDGSVLVWDLSQGKYERRFTVPGAVHGMALTADCSRLAVTCNGDDKVRIFDWKSGKLLTALEAPGAGQAGYVLRFSPDSQVLAVLCQEKNWSDAMRFLSPRTGETVWKTERTRVVTFSPTGQRFAVVRPGQQRNDSQVVEVEVSTGTETVHNIKRVNCCEYDRSGQLYVMREEGPNCTELLKLYPRVTGRLDEGLRIAYFPTRNYDSFSPGDKDNSWWMHSNSWAVTHVDASGKLLGQLPDGVAHQFSNSWQVLPNNLLALVGQQGNVEFWRTGQATEEGQLAVLDDGQNWLASSRAGHFDGTDTAERSIEWLVGTQRYRVEQFFKDGYRPGLIRDFYRGARVGKVAGPLARVHQPPRLEIVEPLPGSRLGDRETEVKVRVVDQGDGKAGTKLYINGHALAVTQTRSTDPDVYIFKVRLQPGTNEIRATAFDSSGQVEARGDQLRITCTASARRLPVLHVLAVGVNQAAAGRLLQFAESDARSFAERLKSDLYSDTQLHVLTGATATKAAVDAEMRKLELAAEPQDTLVVFFAGHGTSESDTYRFLLAGKDAQADSMTSLELASYLETIPAYKQFVVLDTCHSAAASPDLAARFAVSQQRMARGSGTFLLAACRGNETAAEIPSLKHGLLTYSLLSGFAAQGAAPNGQGQITVNSLIQYVSSQFPEVSRRYSQNQELYQFSNGTDFALGVARGKAAASNPPSAP